MISKPLEDMVGSDMVKVGDTVTVGAFLASWVGIISDTLQIISLTVGIVWALIRIYETPTVQNFIKRWRG